MLQLINILIIVFYLFHIYIVLQYYYPEYIISYVLNTDLSVRLTL